MGSLDEELGDLSHDLLSATRRKLGRPLEKLESKAIFAIETQLYDQEPAVRAMSHDARINYVSNIFVFYYCSKDELM